MADEPGRGLWFLKAVFAFIAAAVFVYVLRELRGIFIPFAIALFLYFLLNGAMRRLRQRGIPKPLILTGLLVTIFIGLYLCGLLLFTGASSFINHFPAYSDKIVRILRYSLDGLKLPIIDVQQYISGIDWERVLNPAQVTALVSGTLGDFTGFIGELLLVLLLLMFMLGERVPMATRIACALPQGKSEEFMEIVGAINSRVQHYLFIKTLMSGATACLAALILVIGRVDFVLFTALLVFFLNFIPTFGSLLSTVFPVLVTFLKYGFSLRLVLVTITLMAMQFIMGNVLEPQVMGKSMKLSPIIILLSLIFWGWLWGVVGMVLAVPITSALKIIFESLPTCKPIAAAMSGE